MNDETVETAASKPRRATRHRPWLWGCLATPAGFLLGAIIGVRWCSELSGGGPSGAVCLLAWLITGPIGALALAGMSVGFAHSRNYAMGAREREALAREAKRAQDLPVPPPASWP